MNWNEYQDWAFSKAGESTVITQEVQLTVAALGLSGEAGEFTDTVKKILFHGKVLDLDLQLKMAHELGDVLWYVALAANAIGSTLSGIADLNVHKLNARYEQRLTPIEAEARKDERSQPTVIDSLHSVAARDQFKDYLLMNPPGRIEGDTDEGYSIVLDGYKEMLALLGATPAAIEAALVSVQEAS